MPSPNLVVAILIGALVVIRVISKQVTGSPVTPRQVVVMPTILIAAGLISVGPALGEASAGELALFGVDLIVLGLLGTARGVSTRLSMRDGRPFQKGTALTLLLWLATIGLRVGGGFLAAALGVGGTLTTASMLLSIGLSIGVQNMTIWSRAKRLTVPLAVGHR
ncbi:MAG: hypothetical protein JOZ47_16655 [Kutzneria sp.]|nr:hypothetical protein [Kutzneria sp.]